MSTELVRCTTRDDIPLDGVFFDSQGNGDQERTVDALLLVHGSGGNFYGGVTPYLARRFSAAGYPTASFNTTGHDLVWGAPGRFFGNAYEILDRCRIDLDAAITWLKERGYQRIGIMGHSMGAVKVVYYQAHVDDPRVAAVISSSPVRLSHSYYLSSEAAEEYRAFYEKARALVESGQPDALFPVTFPIPHLFSAGAYLDKHGPPERYNLVKFANKIECPLFLLSGSLETHPRLRDCARDVYGTVSNRPDARLFIGEGADHGWTGMQDKLADEVLHWLDQLKPVLARQVAQRA